MASRPQSLFVGASVSAAQPPDRAPGSDANTAIAHVGQVEAAAGTADVANVAAAVPAVLEEANAKPPTASGSGSSSTSSSSSSDDEEDVGRASEAGHSSSSSEGEELASLVRQKLSISEEVGVQLAPTPLLGSFDLQGVAALIRSGSVKRIVCMCGAGISVSAGIPDFRTPGTGLYSQLERYQLPHPHAVFELDYFRKNPRPFFLLAKELFPGSFLPTPTHYFMRLLHSKGLLQRCFTQNIDSLEHQAGLPAEAVVAAHGNFDSARCIRCKAAHDVEHVRRAVFQGDGSPCLCLSKRCRGLVKPDIVFFGESLPPRFFQLAPSDFEAADLLIVMGTSLAVQPFASLIDFVAPEVPRLLVNRERAGEVEVGLAALGYHKGFNFGAGNYRDALFLGDCDDGVRQLCALLGWQAELDALIAQGRSSLRPPAQDGAAGVEDARGAAVPQAAAAAEGTR